MGCCSAVNIPPDAPKEEVLFLTREAELGFSAHSALRVVGVLSANREEDRVSFVQFNAIAKELKLDTRDIDTLGTPLNAVYLKLMERGKYDAVKLGAMAVLLAKGSLKGAQLYECVGEKRPNLTASEVRTLLEAVLFVSCEALPLLAGCSLNEEPTPTVSYDGVFITEFIENLRPGMPPLCERLTNTILRGRSSVPHSDFLSAFHSDETLSSFTSPYYVRKAVRAELRKVAASRSIVTT